MEFGSIRVYVIEYMETALPAITDAILYLRPTLALSLYTYYHI